MSQVKTHLSDGGEPFAEVDRQTNGPRLTGNRSRHALANPPEGISGKLVSAGWVEFFNGAFKTKGPFLNQIEKFQPLALVFLGDADNKAQIGLHHPFLGPASNPQHPPILGGQGCFVDLKGVVLRELHHRLDLIAQLDLLSRRQQRDATNRAEVPTDWVTVAATLVVEGLSSGRDHDTRRGSAMTFIRTIKNPKCFQQPFRFERANRNIQRFRF